MEPFKNEWTPEMALEIDKYWGQSALEMAVRIVETVGILQSCSPGCTVLEAGCGTGHIYRLVKQANIASYTGLDSSQAMLDIFKERFPDASLVQGDVQALPFDGESFDVVACIEVLRHMQYYDIAIKELVRVAKKAAVFTIEVTQGSDEFIGEGREGAYLNNVNKAYLHYSVDRNANRFIEWVGTEFDCHVDLKPITAKKWMVVINKDRPGKSMSLAPLGGMDSFMAMVSNSLDKSFKIYKEDVPGKIMTMNLKAMVDNEKSRGVDFSISLEAVANDKSE